ncbi:MAG: bacillithiol biosynthesis cysteine-adding enzyme BshC [Chlorobi bacterium]|nr:bacillithiol biosynthesis cysteine-adding enzyme BshC [Chlorobiota bacterium]
MLDLSWCRISGSSSLVCDYTRGDEWLEALFAGSREQRRCEPSAIAAIEQTMALAEPTSSQRANLEKLSAGGAVVISGQQVGFLGGPLYTWLKIATIVAIARFRDAVPVFWIEDNDHDIAEAQQVGIIAPDDTLRTLDCPTDRRYPEQTIVAACRIGEAIAEQLGMLATLYAKLPHADAAIERLEQCYRPGSSWSEAFLQWHNTFWSAHGVLFVRSSVLRSIGAMRPMIERELRSPGELAAAVAEQTAVLVERGYPAQIEAADVNVFFHDSQQRFRIHRDDEKRFRIAGRSTNRDELLAMLDREPDRFSPSAALRPLVQDSLFAPIVTVLGPAELQYHAQLRRVYDRWHVPKPQLSLRCSATLVPPRVMRLLQQYPDDVEVFFQPQRVFDRWLARQLDSHALIERAVATERTVRTALEEFERDAEQLDPTLARSVRATAHVIGERLHRLQAKVRRAILRRNEQQTARFRAARVHVFPNDGLQERSIAPIHWVCSLGIERWAAALIGAAERAGRAHYIATPDELIGVLGTPVVTSYV